MTWAALAALCGAGWGVCHCVCLIGCSDVEEQDIEILLLDDVLWLLECLWGCVGG